MEPDGWKSRSFVLENTEAVRLLHHDQSHFMVGTQYAPVHLLIVWQRPSALRTVDDPMHCHRHR